MAPVWIVTAQPNDYEPPPSAVLGVFSTRKLAEEFTSRQAGEFSRQHWILEVDRVDIDSLAHRSDVRFRGGWACGDDEEKGCAVKFTEDDGLDSK